jgi:mannan endo-1,6-alpha-mannosidase
VRSIGLGDFSRLTRLQGYDDQVFWGLASISAAEWKLEDVPDGYSWLSLAQGVFNYQSAAWDEKNCGGGLRWQMFPYQAGYVIKNSISNGGFFQLAARLARYTHNATYAEWAEKAWDWSVDSLLVNTKTWNVGDTVNINDNCTSLGNLQWSYNYGTYLAGAAYMQSYVSASVASPAR